MVQMDPNLRSLRRIKLDQSPSLRNLNQNLILNLKKKNTMMINNTWSPNLSKQNRYSTLLKISLIYLNLMYLTQKKRMKKISLMLHLTQRIQKNRRLTRRKFPNLKTRSTSHHPKFNPWKILQPTWIPFPLLNRRYKI